MNRQELETLFSQQAPAYDATWSHLQSIRETLHLLAAAAFSPLPEDARLLCVGAGTGTEVAFLARRFPRWSFAIVEPSAGMVAAFREKAAREGFLPRCEIHTGYLDTCPSGRPFHAATALLVSQFLLDPEERTAFFSAIARRLKPGGILISSDLSSDRSSPAYTPLLALWMRAMRNTAISPAELENIRAAYDRDVAIEAPGKVAEMLRRAGFPEPVQLFQAGLIHAWVSTTGDAAPGDGALL